MRTLLFLISGFIANFAFLIHSYSSSEGTEVLQEHNIYFSAPGFSVLNKNHSDEKVGFSFRDRSGNTIIVSKTIFLKPTDTAGIGIKIINDLSKKHFTNSQKVPKVDQSIIGNRPVFSVSREFQSKIVFSFVFPGDQKLLTVDYECKRGRLKKCIRAMANISSLRWLEQEGIHPFEKYSKYSFEIPSNYLTHQSLHRSGVFQKNFVSYDESAEITPIISITSKKNWLPVFNKEKAIRKRFYEIADENFEYNEGQIAETEIELSSKLFAKEFVFQGKDISTGKNQWVYVIVGIGRPGILSPNYIVSMTGAVSPDNSKKMFSQFYKVGRSMGMLQGQKDQSVAQID